METDTEVASKSKWLKPYWAHALFYQTVLTEAKKQQERAGEME